MPGAALCVAVPRVVAHALPGPDARFRVDVVVVGDQHAAFACREVFRRVKAVGGRALELVADQSALVAAFERVRRVFGDEQAVLVGNFIDAVEVADLPAVVHGDDRLCFRRDLFFDLIRVDAAGFVVDVGENGCRAAVDDGACRGGERHRRGDDFVAGADAGRKQRNVERRGAGVHGDGVLCADVLRKFLLKFHGARPFGDPERFHGFRDRLTSASVRSGRLYGMNFSLF